MIQPKQWLVMLLLLCAVSACTDDTFQSSKSGVVDENGMVCLTLNTNVPGLKLTRGVDVNGESIATLWVLAFNEDGYMISRVQATQSNNVSGTEGGTGTFTAKVPGSTRILHFLANVNMDNFSDQANVGRHENEVVAPLLSSSGNLVYWGRRTFATEDDLTGFAAASKTNPVVLYRNQALVQYEVAGSGLAVDGWAVCNQYAYGTVAPFNAEAQDPFAFDLGGNDFVTTLPEDSRVKQRDDEEVSTASDQPGDPRYIFENVNAEDDQVYLIMKIGQADASTDTYKYYKIMLVNDRKEPYRIIRNHKYTVRISNINEAYGVGSFEAAHNATPANNPWITISDEIPEVNNGRTTLRIEGETTVVYQQEGDQTIRFYYNGTARPEVKWLSNDGVASDIAAGDIQWDSRSGEGTITLHVNRPAQDAITYGTLQIKESDGGVLSRRIKVLLTEPFEFAPVWVGSEIPLLDDENITILFNIPEDFPEELLPIDVKFGCDLIDAQTGMENALKVITEETSYIVPKYNEEHNAWEDAPITKDWNYKYVYSAATRGQHRVNFRTILTSLGTSIDKQEEFHIYMEGDDSRNGQDLFSHRDLFFAFQENGDSYRNRYRILLKGEETSTNTFSIREINDLEPVYGETISIPFTLGTLSSDDRPTSNWRDVTPVSGNVDGTDNETEIWVYYDPALVKPTWTEEPAKADYFGNYYSVYKTTKAENEISFTTITPNFDCYIVLSAKSIDGYGDFYADIDNKNHSLGVNNRGYRSASVTIHSTGRLDFAPEVSTDGSSYTPIQDGKFNVAYGTGQHVWLKIQVPEAARDKAFQFRLGTQYLEPADKAQWEKWTVAEGKGWTYTFTENETGTDGFKVFEFVTTRLASEETLTLASGNYVGFNPLTIDLLNPDLTGTIQLPEGVTFKTNSPYVILERKDGIRIGTFDLGEPDLEGKSSATYSLALRGEYNLKESDVINVKWSPVDNTSDVYIYSATLEDIMTDGITINLQKQ